MSAFDFDADPGDFDVPQRRSLKTPDTHRALIQAALAETSTRSVRRALSAASSRIILITTPSPGWSSALASEISQSYENVWAQAVVERRRDDNKWIGESIADRIEDGRHVVLCLHDIDLIQPSVLAAADVQLELPSVNAKMVRRAIQCITGSRIHGLKDSEVVGLDFPALLLALRPGSMARECCERLRRAAGLCSSPHQTQTTGPTVESLPLSGPVSEWAQAMVGQLNAVRAGDIPPSELRHAVLCGPPGTGKTLIAGAVARSAGWKFHSATIGEWFTTSDGNLGGVSRACTSFFDSMLAQDCTVGFLDEIDSLPSRAGLKPQDLQWWSTVINLMLTQVDRLRTSGKKVVLLAATNYYDRLDPALIRSGRLEQQVVVLPPHTESDVLAVFEHYVADEINSSELGTIVPLAMGATPADIAGLVREARGIARRAGRGLLLPDLMDVVAPPDTRSTEEIEAVALHEAGHCVIARVLNIRVDYVSIIGKGRAGGVTHTAALSEFPNRTEVEDYVTMLLAGRAADTVLGNKGPHAGASMDLAAANQLLARARGEWGLFGNLATAPALSAQLNQESEADLQVLLDRSSGLVRAHTSAVRALARALLEERLLVGERVDELVAPLIVESTQSGAYDPLNKGV